LVRTAFCGTISASMVDQNLPHQAGCHRQEVCSVAGIKGMLTNQAQIGLMDQGGALQCVSWTFAVQLTASDLAQFLVDQWD
jgi:hypothetical protein